MVKRILQRRPSPAMVVAILALFVALGGTGYATLKINGMDITNGTITGKKIKNRTLTTKKFSKKTIASLRGRQGSQGPRGVQGEQGPAGVSPVTRFARVNYTGTLVAGGPGSTTVSRTSEGEYTVAFDRDVSKCTVSVTAGAVDGKNFAVKRNSSAEPAIFTGGAAQNVNVIIFDDAGTPVDSSFHLLVYC